MGVETALRSAILSAKEIFDEYLCFSNCVLAIETRAAFVTLIALNRPPPAFWDGRKNRKFDASMFHRVSPFRRTRSDRHLGCRR
jgi:hypothetical protein